MRNRRSRGIRLRPTAAYCTSSVRSYRPAASSRSQVLRPLFACPFRWSFIEEGNDTFARVWGRDEFVEIDFLGSGQALVEVNRVPDVYGLLGVGERYRAQLAEFSQRLDRQSESSSSAATERVARPIAAASSPENWRPVRISSLARFWPMSAGRATAATGGIAA
jgi:hypothetical protein